MKDLVEKYDKRNQKLPPKERYKLVIYSQFKHPGINLIKNIINKDNIDFNKDQIEEICGEMSELERNAEKSSRQVVQQMICYHLKKYIGHEFSSTITGITDFGLFAEIDNFYVSGLIHVADLPGDRYFYDKDANLLKGKRTGRVYRLGQDIKIKIMNVLPAERKITLIPC